MPSCREAGRGVPAVEHRQIVLDLVGAVEFVVGALMPDAGAKHHLGRRLEDQVDVVLAAAEQPEEVLRNEMVIEF